MQEGLLLDLDAVRLNKHKHDNVDRGIERSDCELLLPADDVVVRKCVLLFRQLGIQSLRQLISAKLGETCRPYCRKDILEPGEIGDEPRPASLVPILARLKRRFQCDVRDRQRGGELVERRAISSGNEQGKAWAEQAEARLPSFFS